MTTLDLSVSVVNELIRRTGIDPKEYTGCVFGQVLPSLAYINLAREVVLRTELPSHGTVAHSVSQACVTSVQAVTTSINAIECGEHDVMIAGGADSVDDLPLGANAKLSKAFLGLQKAKTFQDRVRLVASVAPRDLVPTVPGFAVELSTGLSMGQHCELMAKDWGITRQWQDEIAHQSHGRASDAWANGFFGRVVMPVVPPPFETAFLEDNVVRRNSKLEDYAKLRPVFDKENGTITAGNASPLTDGAAAVVVMRES
jgi:acetyl-CoA acyltransferase